MRIIPHALGGGIDIQSAFARCIKSWGRLDIEEQFPELLLKAPAGCVTGTASKLCCGFLQVLHENEVLEDELARVRAGNLRAAEVLAGPLPPPQPHSPAGGNPPPAVAEGRPTDPQQPPPPQPEPPKRPRHDDD